MAKKIITLTEELIAEYVGSQGDVMSSEEKDDLYRHIVSFEKSDKWISVKKKMPEYNVGVLVFIPDEDHHITSGMWDISNKWVLLDEYRVPECKVTHWQEMPDIPQEFHKDREENYRIMRMLKEMEEPLRKEFEENEKNKKNSSRYPHGK